MASPESVSVLSRLPDHCRASAPEGSGGATWPEWEADECQTEKCLKTLEEPVVCVPFEAILAVMLQA